MRRPGHENCGSCPVCALTTCPDCDDEGRFCGFDHASGEDWKRDSVDIPNYRKRPRRRQKTVRIVTDAGAVVAEYTLLTVLVAGIVAASFGLYRTVALDPYLIQPPAQTAPDNR